MGDETGWRGGNAVLPHSLIGLHLGCRVGILLMAGARGVRDTFDWDTTWCGVTVPRPWCVRPAVDNCAGTSANAVSVLALILLVRQHQQTGGKHVAQREIIAFVEPSPFVKGARHRFLRAS